MPLLHTTTLTWIARLLEALNDVEDMEWDPDVAQPSLDYQGSSWPIHMDFERLGFVEWDFETTCWIFRPSTEAETLEWKTRTTPTAAEIAGWKAHCAAKLVR